MEIKEVYHLVKTISDLVAKHNYIAIINQIRTAMNQYKTYKVNNQQQALTVKNTIGSTSKQAISALNEIMNQFNDYKLIKSLAQLKIDNPYGEHATSLLKRIPLELDSNFEGLTAEVTQYHQKINAYQQFTNSIVSVLGDTLISESQERDELIIFFEGEAGVSNLKQLSEVSTEWNLVVNCFSRLTRENNTDIEIVSIKKGSLIANLIIASTIIGGIISASDKILNLILKFYEIKKKALELRKMNLENIAQAIEILEAQSTLNLDTQSKVIVKELMNEFGWQENDEAFQETETAVIKGVKKMIKFQNSGGKVDAKYLKPTEIQEAKVISINQKNKQFLKIEQELGRLSEGGEILKIEDSEQERDIEVPSNQDFHA